MGGLVFNPATTGFLANIGRSVVLGSKTNKLKTASKVGTAGAVSTAGPSLLRSLGFGLAAPLIGGVASLMGGAMSLTGGVLTAGSTIAGIAGKAAGGVLGAVGGLAGGGQSGAVDNSQTQMVPSFAGEKSLTSPGSGLANVKSMLPATVGDGAMSMLPTGEESETTLLSQILGQTRTNTMVLTSILGALTANLAQTRIEGAKKTKGDEKEPGIVRRTFSALGDRLKDLSGSLSTNAKSMLKGVGIVGLLLLFKKYRSQISGVVAGIFETLQGWYDAFQGGGNPITDMFERVRVFFDEQVLPVLKSVLISTMEMLYTAVATIINAILPDFLAIPTTLDMSEMFGVASNNATKVYDSSADSQLTTISQSLGGVNNLGEIRNTYNPYDDDTAVFEGAAADSPAIQALVKSKLQQMYEYFESSGGRIQWTGIGSGFVSGQGIESFLMDFNSFSIADIINSKPLVDGFERTVDDLQNPNLLALPFDKDSPFRDEFIKNLVDNTSALQNSRQISTRTLGSKVITLRNMDDNLNANRLLLDKEIARQKVESGITVVDGKSTTNYNSKTENHLQSGVSDTNMDLNWHWGGEIKQAQ